MADEIIYSITFEGLEESNKKLEKVNEQLIEQKKQVDETKKAIKDSSTQQAKDYKELEALQKKKTSLTEDEQKKIIALNGSITENEKKLDTLNKTLLTQQDELKKTNKERSESVKETELLNKALNSNAGSNDQLKAKLALLTKEYNSLSEEQRENTAGGKQLQSEILGLTEKLKGNEKAVGDNRRNVGNYEQAITSALGKVNIMGVNLGQMTTQIKAGVVEGKSLVQSMTATATATTAQATATQGATVASGGLSGAMKVLRIALISTGIGAIVVALGALVGAFLSTQRGADAVSKALIPIQFVFQRLWGLVQDLSFAMVDFYKKAFTEPLQTLKNFGKGFVEFVTNPIQGVKNIINGTKDAFQQLRRELDQAKKEGEAYAKAKIAMQNAEIKAQVSLAKLNVEIQKNRDLANDQLATEKERINALNNSKKAIEEKYKIEADLLKKEIQLKALEQKQNDTDRTGQLEMAKLEAKLIQLEADKFAEQKRITSQLTGLLKKEQNANEEVTEAIEIKVKTSLELLDDELKAMNKATKSKLINLEFEKNKTLENAQLTADERLQIEKNFESQKQQVQLDSLLKQAETLKTQLEPIFANSEGVGAILLTPEEEETLKEQLNFINAEIAKISQTANGIEGETQGIKLQNALGLDEAGMESLMFSFDVVKEAINSIGNLMSVITDRNRKLIQEQVKEGVKTQEQADKEIEIMERKAFNRQKALQIALATANTFQSALSAFASQLVPGDPSSIIRAKISAGVASIFGTAQVAGIALQKFATGGYVSGKGTATSDSIPAMLSNGEYVINAKAVDALGVNYLNALNSINLPKFATGGLVTPQPIPTTSTSSAQVEQLSQQVQTQELRVINVESDFSSLQNKVQNVERAGTF
jgi:DNA repair exonuclease SbcCD ATPase subunit